MDGVPIVPGVYHISDEEIRDRDLSGAILPTDRIVIPAKHEGANIGTTLGYLLSMGFEPEQIIVLVNGSSEIDGKPDDTAEKALAVNPCIRVYHQNELLNAPIVGTDIVSHLQSEFGIMPERLHGKGTAMFAATLALHAAHTPDGARIIFLDTDIQNASTVDPVGRLLIGAELFPDTVRMVKLASLGRDNAGIHAFLSTLHDPHSMIGALRWPLCGQVVVRWCDLKCMRLASGYAVEMAMMMDLIARADGNPRVFGEVEIGAPLLDKKNSDRVHVRMYSEIMVFMGRAHACARGGLPGLTIGQMHGLNCMESTTVWTPVKERGEGPNRLETRYPDTIFPSIVDLY